MSDSEKKISKVIRQLFYVLFFLTPIIFWPYTSEVFEFNKMMFVYLMTILISSAWLIRSLVNKKFEIVKTPLDIPIIIFIASQIISTIVSINPHTSLWGYYSRFHGGLMSTISYTVLFYALITHFKNETHAIKNLVTAILSSAAIISFYGVLEHFGIDKNVWVQDVQNRVFSSLGQPNWLSAFLVALLPLSLFKTTNPTEKKHRLLYLSLSLLYLMAILFTKSQSGIAASFVVLILFFVITVVQKKKSWLILTLFPLIIIAFIFKGQTIQKTFNSLNKINPFYSDTLTIATKENINRVGGSDSMTIRRIVWEGAIKLGLQHPLFGTGVETFGYSYYWVRPAAHNLTSETDFLYNKAHNEYLNFLATTGFVGLFAYLFLIVCIFYLFLNKKTNHNDLRFPLLLGFVSILITNYFGFSVVNIALFFFLFPAIYISSMDKGVRTDRKIKIDTGLGITVVCIGTLWLTVGLSRAWLADIAFNKGKGSLEESEKAIKLNPNEPIYYSQLGNINALVATQLIAPQIASLPSTTSAEIRAQANTILEKYIGKAVENINYAQKLNPYNLNVLKTKAKTNLALAQFDPKYYQEALNTLLEISRLSPTESSNFQNIGILYQSLGNNDLAKMAFQKALDLNPNNQTAKDYLKKL